MDETKNCKNCTHAIFDEVFGEYKCKKLEIHIYDVDKLSCESHEKKKGE